MIRQQTGKVPRFNLLIVGRNIAHLRATTGLPGGHACLHLVDLQDQPSGDISRACWQLEAARL